MPDPAPIATPDIVPSAAPGAVSATRPVSLAGLRSEIDRIDTAMHELLMERGQVIEQLIEVKKTQVSGSAFRPGREAEMMRRLALRHKGLLLSIELFVLSFFSRGFEVKTSQVKSSATLESRL